MYAFIAFLFRPTVSTKYPLAQKCLFPYLYFRLACRSNIIRLLFPFRYPIIWDTLYFGGMLISMWMWSFFTLTRRLFLVFFSPRHRLFLPPAEPGVVFGCHCRKSRTSALLFPMQRYTVPVTVTVVVPGVTV